MLSLSTKNYTSKMKERHTTKIGKPELIFYRTTDFYNIVFALLPHFYYYYP